MRVLVDWWEMGSFPWLVPFKEDEHDVRRTIEVPDDLYERLVDAHEEFCVVLAEVDVQRVEILDAPAPERPHLLYGRHYRSDDRFSWGGVSIEGYAGVCRSCGSEAVVPSADPSRAAEARALGEILGRGWRERRHGGLACPGCAPTEVLLPEKKEVRG